VGSLGKDILEADIGGGDGLREGVKHLGKFRIRHWGEALDDIMKGEEICLLGTLVDVVRLIVFREIKPLKKYGGLKS